MTLNDCACWLAEHDGYLIISHKHPDGDTLGSGAALCSALRRMGKTAYCFDNPEITRTYIEFISQYIAPQGFVPSCVITVDVADEKLFPYGVKIPIDLAIDHHSSNTYYASNLYLDVGKSSCGEIVLELIKALCGSVSVEEANLLYISISTDTGCFMYMNTNAHSFRAAAELLELGADNRKLNTVLFRTMSRERLALEGMIYSGLRYYKEGKIVVSIITLDMMESTGATEDDCEDLSGIPGKAEGAMMAVTIRQLAPEKCKISARSKPEVNSSDICAVYGGGGHLMAAGCTMEKDPEAALKALLGTIYEKWPEKL